MASRSGPDTVKKAIERVPGGVAGVIQSNQWTIATLLDAMVGGRRVIKDALNALSDSDFIHASVAAIYCRCSETTFNNHRKPLGSLSDLKKSGDTEMRSGAVGPQTRRERYYRIGFVKEVRDAILKASDDGDDARAAKLVRQHTPKGRLARELLKKIAWLVDENGHIYAAVTIECEDGTSRMAKLFKNGARIEMLTFQQAMTERTWTDPAQRAPFHDYYLSLLDAERQLLVTQGEVTSAVALVLRLEEAIPETSRRGRPPGMRDH